MCNEETIAHEFGVYCSVSDNFPKYVVSLDEFDMSCNGIITQKHTRLHFDGRMELGKEQIYAKREAHLCGTLVQD